ncbi:hypothetical protein OH809_30395 [Streptomyces sp. NBC_00873]|uniref:hypothetical protein n=1 Tax=Streptomyces sp. NBC_00873 TaxID=2975852 RepID=UPI00386980FC|nr:hypothetical protein OH809_30395 [Streptomyces sp. NBC_00873]
MKTLRDRDHKCIACGLAGKRDLVSAALAAFVRLADVDDPKTAYLDTAQSRHAQIIFGEGLEEALRKSTTQSQNTHEVLVAWQSHGNAVRPLLPEPPHGGAEQTR